MLENVNKSPQAKRSAWWQWDAGWNMISEHEGGGSWTVGDRTRTFIPGLAEVPGTDPDSGSYWYYAQDHLGSLRALYDGNKALIGKVEYEPYGMIRTGAGPATIPGHTFTGHMFDQETGMYFAPYRYYSPMTARWLTRDPLGFVAGLNIYAYSFSNPVLFVDVLGLSCRIKDGHEGWFEWFHSRGGELFMWFFEDVQKDKASKPFPKPSEPPIPTPRPAKPRWPQKPQIPPPTRFQPRPIAGYVGPGVLDLYGPLIGGLEGLGKGLQVVRPYTCKINSEVDGTLQR